jgi:hypothetical protein
MSTARNRFGVSILVALVLGVLLTATPASAGARGVARESGQPTTSDAASDLQLFGAVAETVSATSGRTQTAIALARESHC